MTATRIIPLAALGLGIVLPLVASPYYVEILAGVLIFALFALSLGLLVGYTGLVSLGHAAYFGLGAYALALISPKYESVSFFTSFPAAIALAAVSALVVGFFVIKTKGVYFIMATLAFSQMFYFVFHDTKVGGGSDGMSLNFKPEIRIFDIVLLDLGSALQGYYVILAFLVVVVVFLHFLLRSTFGHAIKGIKCNEHRMVSLGFPVFRYKLASFTIAGGLAGAAGYLYTMFYGMVNPELLSWHQSGEVLLMVILGGPGSLYGAIGGAFVFTMLRELFGSMTIHWQLLLGVTIVLLVLFMPGGLAKFGQRLRLIPGSKPE
ncbi:MAG: branched-chain amino acid ABC transporter permease [Pseudomonadota bacterium]